MLKTWICDAQKHDTVVAGATDYTALLRENERLRHDAQKEAAADTVCEMRGAARY